MSYKFFDTTSIHDLTNEKDTVVVTNLGEMTIDTKNTVFHLYEKHMGLPLLKRGIELTDATKTLAAAFNFDNTQHPDDTIFVTGNYELALMANLFFGEDSVEYRP